MVRKSQGITERHMKILKFLQSFQDEYGYPPTIRQIGEHIGVNSTSQVTYYLKQLETKNLIERDEHTSRSIRVLKNVVQRAKQVADEIWSIPVFGRIVASEPIPMPPTDASYFDDFSSVELARSLFEAREKPDDLFALEVEGDSMIDAMVNSGDIVIMRQANEAKNGEMVAVWLDDENSTTLKYFYKEGTRVRLQPANPTMRPIYIDDPKNLRIMGKVVMVVRQIQKEPQAMK
jgi:repressor LexA